MLDCRQIDVKYRIQGEPLISHSVITSAEPGNTSNSVEWGREEETFKF